MHIYTVWRCMCAYTYTYMHTYICVRCCHCIFYVHCANAAKAKRTQRESKGSFYNWEMKKTVFGVPIHMYLCFFHWTRFESLWITRRSNPLDWKLIEIFIPPGERPLYPENEPFTRRINHSPLYIGPFKRTRENVYRTLGDPPTSQNSLISVLLGLLREGSPW